MGCGVSKANITVVSPYSNDESVNDEDIPAPSRTDSDLSSVRTARFVNVSITHKNEPDEGVSNSPASPPSVRQAWDSNHKNHPTPSHGKKSTKNLQKDSQKTVDKSLGQNDTQASKKPGKSINDIVAMNSEEGDSKASLKRSKVSLEERNGEGVNDSMADLKAFLGQGTFEDSKTSRKHKKTLKKRHSYPEEMFPPLVDYSLEGMSRSQTWCHHGLYRPALGPLYSKTKRFSVSEVDRSGKNWDLDASRHAYFTLHHGNGDAQVQVKGQNPTPNSGSPFKPPLMKTYAIDDDGIPKKLKRGMSKTLDNMYLVDKARNIVLSDVKESSLDHTNYFVDTPEFTFMLPDLTVYSEDFRAFLEKDLIETSTLVSLEQAGRLNWWADIGACQRLLPLATSGDGNCLLHAASLGMWGFHDRLLTLRKALFNTMSNGEHNGAIWRRWRWQQILFNREAELVYSEEEWQNEWLSVLQLASTKPRSQPGRKHSCCDSPATRGGMERLSEEDHPLYESLEEIHVFVLAHVLRRPIVVVADVMLKDSNGDALALIPFGGIYLPMECNPKECHRSPLVLTYDAAHFSALVAMEMETSPDVKPRLPAVIPLIDPDFKVLPIHFDVDPGQSFDWNKDPENPEKTRRLYLTSEQKWALLERYMDVCRVTIPKHEIDNLANSKESVNTNDSDECKSSSGSCESEDSTGMKEKSKVAKQMNTVAKQFGSIGKTMSKKLKKNFGGITKAMKSVTGSESPQLRTRRASVSGSQTQSTNLSVTVEMLKDKEHIICAKLSNKRAKYQEEMIKNYLHSAHERFEYDRDMKRKRGSELKMKVEQKRLSRETIKGAPVQCISPGCTMFGTDETSYLCSSCFSRQKQEALNFQNSQAVHKDKKTNLVTIANATSGVGVNTSGHSGAVGKSKFFAGKDPVVLRKEPVAQSSNNLNNQMSSQNDTLHLSNSTFYDGSRSPNLRRSAPAESVQNLQPGGSVLHNQRISTPESSPRVVRVQQRIQSDGSVVIPVVQATGKVQQQQPVAGRQSSPLTGYDNLDMVMQSQCNIKPSPHPGKEEPLLYCRSTGCKFYGSEQFDYLCSGCYKVKAQNIATVETTQSRQTRL